MRLTCPNCDAQYEVPDEVIPSEGRDVQCSNCGQTWFQPHPDHAAGNPHADAAEDEPDQPVAGEERAATPSETGDNGDDNPDDAFFHDGDEDDTTTQQDAPGATGRGLSPDVADILREEAEFEARARAQEREALESQTELGLEQHAETENERRARESRQRMAKLRGEQDTDLSAMAATATAVAEATSSSSRKDLLPDIDEINSTLRSGNDRGAAHQDDQANNTARTPGNRSFRRGFAVAVIIAVATLALYRNAPQVVERVPQLDPYISAFVANVDSGRAWLDRQATDILTKISQSGE